MVESQGSEVKWNSGWYAVTGDDVRYTGYVTVKGDVRLILCDGATLTVNGFISVDEGNSLSIYAGKPGKAEKADILGNGALNANGSMQESTYCAGIGSSNGNPAGTINICGGRIKAVGQKYGAGIGGGGSVNNTGGEGGNITIRGGVIEATNSFGAGIGGGFMGEGGNIEINGGVVTAIGGVFTDDNGTEIAGGIGAGRQYDGKDPATITLKPKTPGKAPEITASTYVGTLTLTGDFCEKLTGGSYGAVIDKGSVSDAMKDIIKGRTIVPVDGTPHAIKSRFIPDSTDNRLAVSVNGIPTTRALKGTALTLVVEGIEGKPVRFALSGATYGGNTVLVPKNGVFTMPDADVTVSLTQWAWLQQKIDEAAKTANSPAITLTYDFTAQPWETALVVPAGEPVTIDLNGHKIDRALKSAVDGGNVITVDGTLTVKDTGKDQKGMITGGNNTANGGGVIVSGAFNMSGGTISGNAAKKMGGGVYVGANGTFSVSGNPVVSDNHQGDKSSGSANNVCLSSGKKIAIKDKLGSAAKIGVTTETAPTKATSVPFTSGLEGNGMERFTSDNAAYKVILSAMGEAMLVVPLSVTIERSVGGKVTLTQITGQPVTGNDIIIHDDILTLKTEPDEGYVLPEGGLTAVYANENGKEQALEVEADGKKQGVFNVVMPGADVTVRAVFEYSPTITAPRAISLTFNDQDQALVTAGSVNVGTLWYAIGTKDAPPASVEFKNGTIPTGKDAGDYYVWYKAVDEATGKSTEPLCVAAKIDPETVDKAHRNQRIDVETNSRDYNGAAHQPGVTVSRTDGANANGAVRANGSMVIPASEYTVSYKNNVDAGTAKVIITDKPGGNYIVNGETTFTIEKRKATVTAANQTVKVGRSIQTDVGMVMMTGLAEGHTLKSVTLTSTGTAKASTRGTITPAGAVIVDANGRDVTKNYEISYAKGVLTVTDEPEPEPTPQKADYTLFAQLKVCAHTALRVTWTKVEGADGYDVYFAKNGDSFTKDKAVSVTGALTCKFTGLKKKTVYKAYVQAWKKVNGKKTAVGKASPTVCAVTGNADKKRTNAAKVTVKKAKLTLKVGKNASIKASVKGAKSGKQVLKQDKKILRYYSSDRRVATVNKSGKVKAAGKGSCTIWVIAANGLRTSVKVKVK